MINQPPPPSPDDEPTHVTSDQEFDQFNSAALDYFADNLKIHWDSLEADGFFDHVFNLGVPDCYGCFLDQILHLGFTSLLKRFKDREDMISEFEGDV